MNAVVPEVYLERLQRLAVGFEPLDAARGGRLPHPVRFEVERPLPRPPVEPREPFRRVVRRGDVYPVIDRHDSCLYALLYQPALRDGSIDLRIYDHRRRYVPRRLRVPLLTVAQAEANPFTHRVRRPALFPGAAYDICERVTGLRGRVLRGGAPMRWARVEATLPATATLVGRAHGDDRGEFLLLLDARSAPGVELGDPLAVRVTVSGPAVAPVPAPADLPAQDPLWDLPVEALPTPGDPDPVSAGTTLPAGFVSTLTSTRIIPFRLGRLISAEDFQFA